MQSCQLLPCRFHFRCWDGAVVLVIITPSRFSVSVAARVAAHDILAAIRGGFIEREFHIEAAAVLVRPARGYFRPYVFVEIAASSYDAIKFVGWRAAFGLALWVRRKRPMNDLSVGGSLST